MNNLPNTVLLDGKPVAPGKIVCIGRNYVEHIHELGNEIPDDMVVFIKPNSAISNHLRADPQEPLHYEGEICFMVIDSRLAAVGFGLDITKRQLQSRLKTKGLPWERAKAFDGSALFSPFVTFEERNLDLSLQLKINEQIRQQGSIDLMIYQPLQILQELQTFMTLNDGDIIMTGTPKGVGEIITRDHFEGSISQSGETLTSASWLAE